MTFTATAENDHKEIVGQLSSKIVSTRMCDTNFSFLKQKGAFYQKSDPITHVLSSSDAYNYLTVMKSSYNLINFKNAIDQQGHRVERFGLEVAVVRQIVSVKNIYSLALFLGRNNIQKMTAVFIGKNIKCNFIIDYNSDSPAKVHDFTKPCPTTC